MAKEGPETNPLLKRLSDLNRQAEAGGGAERQARQRSSGKLTARERIEFLLDDDSFEELDKFVTHRCQDFGMQEQQFPGDGVVSGFGRIEGRLVYVFAQDFTVFGGSLSETNAQKICKVMDLAMKMGAPVIGLNDSGGARIQEGVVSLAGYADIFLRNTLASGVVPPNLSCYGALCRWCRLLSGHYRFRRHGAEQQLHVHHGPDVIKTVTHEEVSKEESGGALTHNRQSGVAHFATNTNRECLSLIRELLSFLPSNNLESPPVRETQDPVDRAGPRIGQHRSG